MGHSILCSKMFVRRYEIVYCIGTHVSVSQCGKDEVADEATDYIKYLYQQLQDNSCHDKCLINMDQTPFFFTMHPSKTLDAKGVLTVYIKCGKHDTKRATVVVTFTAAGEALKPMMIFKGARNGRINVTLSKPIKSKKK